MKQAQLLLIILLLPLSVWSQEFRWEGGLQVGATNYTGDLVDPAFVNLRETQLGFGLFLRHRIHPNWSTRLNAFYGKLTGDDRNYFDVEWRTQRAFQFSTIVNELSLLVEWEPFGHKRTPKPGVYRKMLSPYLFAGFGTSIFDPNPNFNLSNLGEFKSLAKQDDLSSFAQTHQTVPFGLGLKFNQSEHFNIGLEFSARTAFTDYIDGVSQSGNPENDDWYFFGGVSVSFQWAAIDTDGDGIADFDDVCPELAGSQHLRGCPDMDNDNIADDVDKCPDLPGGKSGQGCPDSDMDGVVDWKDQCPDIPGPKERDGCPNPDFDGDGIVNHLDNCPKQAGPSYKQGCPLVDSDRDGIIDGVDQCPHTEGSPFAAGCPDKDGDGIADGRDKCPNKAGIAAEAGCPLVVKAAPKKAEDSFKEVVQNAFFETNSTLLSPDHYVMLDKIVELVNKQPYFKVRIKGHADSTGSPNYNKRLSEQRAKACVNYLLSQGVPLDRIKFTGYGESQPDENNNTEEGRRLNRRVEFNLYKAEDISKE